MDFTESTFTVPEVIEAYCGEEIASDDKKAEWNHNARSYQGSSYLVANLVARPFLSWLLILNITGTDEETMVLNRVLI